jgi:hypothetical protein
MELPEQSENTNNWLDKKFNYTNIKNIISMVYANNIAGDVSN